MDYDHSKPLYHTKMMQLAAYLVASDKLTFSHLEKSVADGRLRFIFIDGKRIGQQLALDFESGRALIEPRSLFAGQTFLRREMSNFQASPAVKSTPVVHGERNDHIEQSR